MSDQERMGLVGQLRAFLQDAAPPGAEKSGTSDADQMRRPTLVDTLVGIHPADIAEAMDQLSDAESLAVFRALDNARAAEVLDEIDPDTARYLLDNDVAGRIAGLLDILPMDDAAEVVAELSESNPERAEELIDALEARSPEDAAEVRELLSYGDQTAGRLMTDKFVRLLESLTVDAAFAAIRQSAPDVETLSDLYVVEQVGREERLTGVLSLRDLVRAEPDQLIRQIMVPEPITVTVDTDQEEVARLISKYDFLALPVLDRHGFLAGIVTVDDVVDILVEEQTEDVLKQGAIEPGILDAPYFATPILRAVRSRVTWLILLFVAESATTAVLGHYEDELHRETALAIYLPLLVGTGGNTGAQTVATVIRGLSLKEIRGRDAMRVMGKELATGLLLGFLLGVIAFARASFTQHRLDIGLTVGLAIWGICASANVVGALVPLAAQKLKIDPALVSAPLITTIVDATGLAIYLIIAKVLIASLH